MNLSYNWLKKHIDVKLTPEQLASELTLAGLEVEQINHMAKADHLVIGEILEIEAHPDADTLKVTQVDLGTEVKQIVCGAKNVDKGQKVIVAKVGANVNGLKIKEANIRGVDSFGMICSLSELGVDKKLLTEDQLAGIEVLDPSAEVGSENVLEYLGLDDVIIDVDLTPNRSDCLSMFNVVHEVSALLDVKENLPMINDNSDGKDTELCVSSESDQSLQIVGKIIGDITIKPSVPWMVEVLRANGMQAINNVVDISNIVMLETGQPLHFYDLEQIPKAELIVKQGLKQKYKALNDETYQIREDDLVITSNNEIVGIAGVIGGDNSKIVDTTTSIIIEAANFDLARIRKTSRDLNVSSEAASRFSKGIDPNAPQMATNRAVDLLIEYADAKEIEKTVVYNKMDLDKKIIVTSPNYINSRLGIDLNATDITRIFERLNFNPVEIDNTIKTHVPTYRLDIVSEVDLSEEVVRLYGVDKLPATMPYVLMAPNKEKESAREKQALVGMLLGSGFNETISYSLVSQRHLDHALMPIGEPVTLSNPISGDKKYYRTSLFASMLDVISYNEARGNTQYALYEIANVYDNDNKSQERLSVAFSVKHEKSIWQNLVNIENFYTFKGRMESLLNKLGISDQRIKVKKNEMDTISLHPHQSAEVYIDNKLFGLLGKIHPKLEEEYDINTVLIGEFNLGVVYNAKKSRVKFTPIPRYPGISRDVALIVDEDLASENLIKSIMKTGKSLVKSAEVFDVYQGDNMEEGKKSIAIHIFYQSLDRTLTDQDVVGLHEDIVEQLVKEYNVVYRK